MSHARLVSTLHALRHVQGVLGSFLWMDDGRLVASDLTPGRSPAVLQMATRRLASIATAYASAGECLDHLTLTFDKYQLHISGVANASLVVVLARACSREGLIPMIEAVLRELGRMPELGLATPLTAADPGLAGRSYRGGRILE
ncbi:MAG TPA: hypothetical protein VFN67_07945 [Polyangiales bacterium]|nr:hypothetical protein [Polyangiales bacterium]